MQTIFIGLHISTIDSFNKN